MKEGRRHRLEDKRERETRYTPRTDGHVMRLEIAVGHGTYTIATVDVACTCVVVVVDGRRNSVSASVGVGAGGR